MTRRQRFSCSLGILVASKLACPGQHVCHVAARDRTCMHPSALTVQPPSLLLVAGGHTSPSHMTHGIQIYGHEGHKPGELEWPQIKRRTWSPSVCVHATRPWPSHPCSVGRADVCISSAQLPKKIICTISYIWRSVWSHDACMVCIVLVYILCFKFSSLYFYPESNFRNFN